MILLHEQSRHYGVPNQTFSSQVISPLCNRMHSLDLVGIGAGGAISLYLHPPPCPPRGGSAPVTLGVNDRLGRSLWTAPTNIQLGLV